MTENIILFLIGFLTVISGSSFTLALFWDKLNK